jgi:hypothetical protein
MAFIWERSGKRRGPPTSSCRRPGGGNEAGYGLRCVAPVAGFLEVGLGCAVYDPTNGASICRAITLRLRQL